MRRLIPSESITPLKLLGKYDWLWWTPLDTSPPKVQLKLHIPPDPALAQHRCLIATLKRAEDENPVLLFRFYVFSKALADGPKLLRPTTEQCVALEHVDVNVSFEEYELPFPTVLLELPGPYRSMLTERFGQECPEVVAVHHDRRTGYIISVCERRAPQPSSINPMSPRRGRRTIEEALRFSVDEGNDMDQGKVVQRIALNFGLLMTHYGVRVTGPADPVGHAKQLRNARRANRAKAKRATALLDAKIKIVEFDQDVVVYEGYEDPRSDNEVQGETRRPHWRRGHFRRQPIGHARSERKLVFIRPILVNAAHFHGDIADTKYQLRTGVKL